VRGASPCNASESKLAKLTLSYESDMIAMSKFIITTTIRKRYRMNISIDSRLVYWFKSNVPSMLIYAVKKLESGRRVADRFGSAQVARLRFYIFYQPISEVHFRGGLVRLVAG
jgi:hypothetical protein